MTQWVPGQSGNPKGRPRRGHTAAELSRAIAQERIQFVDCDAAGDPVETATYTRLERLVRVLWTKALDGDIRAIRCLLEYMEGKPAAVVVATVDDDGLRPLSVDEFAVAVEGARKRLSTWEGGNRPAGATTTSGESS